MTRSGPCDVHTVALNPAIDLTVGLSQLVPGEVARARSARHDPGGKGVNVASCLADWGTAVTIHGLLGLENAARFEALFAAKGISDAMVRLPQATRTNIKLLEEGGRTTDVNLPGFSASARDLAAVEASLAPLGAGALVAISGSQPQGLEDEASARLTAALTRRGARVVLDVSGAPLRAALARAPDALPFAIKPNRHELEACLRADLSRRADLVAAARGLVARGIGLVIVSLGTEGAIFLSAAAELQALPMALSQGSTVGAGDAMVAGVVAALAEGLGPEALAARATAFAVGKLRNAGPHLPERGEIRALERAVAVRPLAEWLAQEPGA